MFKPLLKVAALALVLACSSVAFADDYTEVGDAGSTPGTASFTPGTNPLTGIVGTFTAGATHADVYRIFIANPMLFSASTIGGSTSDTQLFLFTAAGIGIAGNDDAGVGVQSCLGAAPGCVGGIGAAIIGALTPGEYLLGISQFDVDPIDAAGLELFTDVFPGLQTPIAGRGPLAGFNSPGGTGTYRIALTGADHVMGGGPPAAIPEPATMVLLGIGLAGVAGAVRKQRKS